MDNLNNTYSSLPVLERNKRLKISRQKKCDVYYCLALMFAFSGLFLWWGGHSFFSIFTETLTPEEKLGTAKNVMNLWNVLMYFVPFILFSLSAGCFATALLGGITAELQFWGAYVSGKLFEGRRSRVITRKMKQKEGGPDAHS